MLRLLLRIRSAHSTAAGADAASPVRAAPEPAPAAAPKLPSTSVIANIGDLQHVGPAALQAAKARMSVVFEANAIKPGDPGYVYDKRVSFTAPQEASEWDD